MPGRDIGLQLGDRVVYRGAKLTRPNTSETLLPGDVGTVVSIIGPEGGERGRDGYASVKWPNWDTRRAILPTYEGVTWERG